MAIFMKSGVSLPSVPTIVYWIAQQWDQKRIFLQDGDALAYPYDKLVEVLQYINEKFPRLDRIASYATPQDILRRSQQELENLRRLKLGIFYTGVESGDNEVLKNMGKGVDNQQIVDAGRKAKQAGFAFSVTIILGLGGVDGSEQHTQETSRILTNIDPDYAGALTLTLVTGTPLHERWQKGDFHPIDPFQSLEELKTIIKKCSFSNCFFSSMHASNYFSVRGKLPREKQRMLKELEDVLIARNFSQLRPEFLRGL